MLQDDAILVQRVLAGDQAAFSPLIDRHWSSAMRLALRRLGNVADAEDTVQDAFLHAVVSLASLQKVDRFGSWLLGIVDNLCRMYWRAHRNGRSLDDEARWVINPFPSDGEVAPSPEALYEAREEYQTVMAALATLPPEQQQAVQLHYLNVLSL